MIADEDGRLRHEVGQDRAWIAVPSFPQVRAIISVETDRYLLLARRFYGCASERDARGPQCRGNSGKMKQACAIENLRPVEIARRRIHECASGAVIGNAAADRSRWRLEEIEPQTPLPADAKTRVDARFAKRSGRTAAKRVVGQNTRHARSLAESGERNRDVGFGPTHIERKCIGPGERCSRWRRKTQQHLAETDDRLEPGPGAHRASHPPSTARMWPWT